MSTVFRRIVCLTSVVLASLSLVNASASQMNLGLVFSAGSVPPSNPSGPWLNYSVQSLGPNSIFFTLTATTNMTDPEKIKEFFFNFDDTLTVADLSFTLQGTAGAFTTPTISRGLNALKADGDGWYDLRLNFDTSGGLADYFNAGDSISYLLTYTGAGAMTEASFEFLSQPGGSEGTYYAAAHILSTPNGGSAWLGATTVEGFPPVPEPSIAALVLAAFGVMGLRRVRK